MLIYGAIPDVPGIERELEAVIKLAVVCMTTLNKDSYADKFTLAGASVSAVLEVVDGLMSIHIPELKKNSNFQLRTRLLFQCRAHQHKSQPL